VSVRWRAIQQALGGFQSQVERRLGQRGGTHMNPAPPVIMMFLVSWLGSNLVTPLRIGASFQMPVSCSFAVNVSGEEALAWLLESDQSRRNWGSSLISRRIAP